MSSSDKQSLSVKPGRTTRNKDKAAALAAVTKGSLSRLNANVDSRKYKKLQAAALHNDTDITALVNGWIDAYLLKVG